jgi:hypothetical protein
MNRSPFRRALSLLVVTLAMPLFTLGCPKKPAPVEVDSGLDEPSVVDAGVTQLEPLDDDSGPEAAPPAPAGHAGGGGSANANQYRIKQCCAAMRKQAAGMGASPEANILVGFAAQCDLIAAQAVGGTAPEFGVLRQMIAGRTLPAACAGL